ncbi:MAG: S-layer homology domain-containing protein, partial [Oscillospiraceae bacterium]|nr:S-layer homology domain-containing protein [Oscillospiraceae bacterium]
MIRQNTYTGAPNQQWILEYVGSWDMFITTNQDGSYRYFHDFSPLFTGMDWSLTAIAPGPDKNAAYGYYTQWVNMTGDENGDGYIDEKEKNKIQNKSASIPDEVYGNKISGELDQDNLMLYYYFLPKTSAGGSIKTGKVTRESENFYQLANHIESSKKPTPVVGAYVDVAGFIGMTDGNGKYSIQCNGLPPAGNVATTITADGSSVYYKISKLQMFTGATLPALSKFDAVSTSASYAKTNGTISDEFIVVNDDTLTLTAVVSSNKAIIPEDARFFIYDNNGNEIKALNGEDGYTVTTQTLGNKLTASLSFNPLKDMKAGYGIYVQFADQNGEWTNVIDLGYSFLTKLNLAEFVFPLIGSSSLEDTITTGFVADIIGNPLADMKVGDIKGFNETLYRYTPSRINKDDSEKYTWSRTDYTYGWSEKFYRKESGSSKENDEKKLLEYLKSVYDGKSNGAPPPAASKFATQSRFWWEVTPTVGFKLTLSTRKDDKNNTYSQYFEDLVFYLKVDYSVTASQTIQLPIGLSILVQGDLKGNAAGIYHMYVDYQDSYETEDAVKYTTEDFGIFKKFNNSVRREGYIFLDPTVSIKLGIGVGIIHVTGNANFIFDMDFKFTETGTYTYGDIKIDLGWGIQLIGYEVYSKSLYDVTYKLFNSPGQNGHIDFDYENASLSAAAEYFEAGGDEKLTLDKPVSRDYLKNRSEWMGEDAVLMSSDASEGTVESTLRNGITDTPYVRMAELDNGEILAVFIDDDESRSNVNKRALFYTIYNGSVWSQPLLVDDDGTPDDYPALCDLGDGRIFIAWSSAEKVLPDDATVEDALKAMNIKAAFFDKQTKQLGETMNITKTTDEDYTADIMPGAAYDAKTDRLILYYTKTEYDGLENLIDISDAYSVNAYMLYENGRWSDENDYTDEELDGMENPEEYKKNWYGQRFIDLRVNSLSNGMPRVVDSAAIGYNGLGLFAWTADWDGSLETNDDRDVFMQIYNFEENSFTHIIRVTPETSVYTTPKFERSDNHTYLFYGANAPAGSDESAHGEIKYLNVSELIKNDRFEKISDGYNSYYIFRYTHEAHTVEDYDGGVMEIPEETVTVTADTATVCDNVTDYDVKVSDDGQMYLFWTDTVNDARQIAVSVYNGSDSEDESGENREDADTSESFWSEPVVLTNAEADEYYSGIGAAVVDGTIFAVSAKGNYNDKSKSSLVWQKHIPFERVKTTGIRFAEEYPLPSSSTDLMATVKNEGLATRYVSENPVTVTFTINGEPVGTADVISPIPGGASVDVICSAEMLEDISNAEIGAYIEKTDAVSTKIETKGNIVLENSSIRRYKDHNNEDMVKYSATVKNTGNAVVNDIVFTAVTGETEVGVLTLESSAINSEQNTEIILDIPDSAYVIGENGTGVAEIIVEAVSGDETVAYYNGTAEKVFSVEAVELLGKVTEISFENDGKYTMKSGDKKDIQPAVKGDDTDGLKVQWLQSSDGSVAYINYDNMIVAENKGRTTLTGILVPSEEKIEFDASGNAREADWKALIPEDKLITVTAEIDVSETKRSGGNTSGGGSAAANSTGTPAPTKTPVPTETPEPTETPGPQTTPEPQKDTTPLPNDLQFDDTANHWAKDYIEKLASYGFVNGVSDRVFEPDGNITRAQFVQMLMNTGLVEAGESNISDFADVSPDAWYYDAVSWAVSCGVAQGMSDEIFEPESLITREQTAAMTSRFIKLTNI